MTNAELKKRLARALELISEAQGVVTDARDELQSELDEMENTDTQRGEKLESQVASLDEADDSLTTAAGQIEEATA